MFGKWVSSKQRHWKTWKRTSEIFFKSSWYSVLVMQCTIKMSNWKYWHHVVDFRNCTSFDFCCLLRLFARVIVNGDETNFCFANAYSSLSFISYHKEVSFTNEWKKCKDHDWPTFFFPASGFCDILWYIFWEELRWEGKVKFGDINFICSLYLHNSLTVAP